MGNTATTKKGDSTESGKFFFYFVSPDGGDEVSWSGPRTIRRVVNGLHCPKYLHAKFR